MNHKCARWDEGYIKKNHPTIYNEILSNKGRDWFEKTYLYRRNLFEPPKCPICGAYNIFRKNRGWQKTCSKVCANKLRIKNIKETNIKKYGVKCTLELNDIREKGYKTKRDKYNDPNFTNRKKARNTCLERYGVRNFVESQLFKDRARQTKLNKYGNEFFINHEKYKQTCLERYGVESNLLLTKHITKSKFETEIFNYINTIIPAIQSDRKTITPYELDIYIPTLKIAFEINGTYWHSSKVKNPMYHINKSVRCLEMGVNCFFIWEDWEPHDIRSFIEKIIHRYDVSEYKQKWFPDLDEKAWPVDLGWRNYNNWAPHISIHDGFECYDAGILIETEK